MSDGTTPPQPASALEPGILAPDSSPMRNGPPANPRPAGPGVSPYFAVPGAGAAARATLADRMIGTDAPLGGAHPRQIEREADGQAVRKRLAVESRESSVSSYRGDVPPPTDSAGSSVAGSRPQLAVPQRVQEGMQRLQAGSPLGTSRSGSTDTAGSSAPPPPVVPAAASRPPTKTAQELDASRIQKLYPKVSVEDIQAIIDRQPNADGRTVIMQIRAKNNGQVYTGSIKPRTPGSGSGFELTPSSANSSSSTPFIPSFPAPHLKPRKDPKATSAIYANRGPQAAPPAARPVGTPLRPASTAVSGANTPNFDSPVLVRRKKRRAIDSSASESEFSENDSEEEKPKVEVGMDEGKAFGFFNACTAEELMGTIACSPEQAGLITGKLRPYKDLEDLRKKLSKTRGVSPALFQQYIDIVNGYIEVDQCLAQCEAIGNEIAQIMSIWTGQPLGARTTGLRGGGGTPSAGNSGTATPSGGETGIHATSVDVSKLEELVKKDNSKLAQRARAMYRAEQPAGLVEGVKLKDYQLLGLNWLHLLWSKKLSCILADDMGLGKTIQVISFLQLLRETKGIKGPHLIIVPSSTLENWAREFGKFSRDIDVRTYYGSQADRAELQEVYRQMHLDGTLEVLLTTYDLAWKEDDNKFLRKRLQFETCIYDEGHTLKNYQSQRYISLMRLRPRWRLLLTGTPLQNNLQELVSLLKFMQPTIFESAEEELRQIFKVHAKGTVNLLSQQRVSRARIMMTPFVLRRKKAQVLDLPPRVDKTVKCRMTPLQETLYKEALRRNKAAIEEVADDDDDDEDLPPTAAKKRGKKEDKKREETSTNVLMNLRKAASHPMLFRTHYDDRKIQQLAKAVLKDPDFKDSSYDLVVEDMTVMTDAELHFFCKQRPKTLGKHALQEEVFLDVGKVEALKAILADCKRDNKRMLLFSQLTQILDILQLALDHLGIKWIRLDGSTRVDERQALVDEFTEDEDIRVFLLSTRAGGMGINLVAACVVCIYDQDFNPHNDRQAADRAYRIGQTRPVEVIKLISEDSIDEDMYQIGQTKLQLDDAVGGFNDADPEGTQSKQTEAAVKKSLLTNLRAKLETDGAEDGPKKAHAASGNGNGADAKLVKAGVKSEVA